MPSTTETSYQAIFQNYYEKEFPIYNPDKIFNRVYEKRPKQATSDDQSVYVTYSIFVDCCAQSEGGAIYYNNVNGKLLIERSTFIRCRTDNDKSGGSIWVYGCDCLIYCVCSYESITNNAQGQFAYLKINEDLDRVRFIMSTSICYATENGQNRQIIYSDYGKQYINFVNLSHNSVYSRCGITLDHGIGTTVLSYCSIDSNEASTSLCIGLWHSGNTEGYEIDNCNIINNKQNAQNEGIIHCLKPTQISNCCILDNTEDHLLYAGAQVTLSNCTLPESFSATQKIVIIETAKNDFSIDLQFTFEDRYCFRIIATTIQENRIRAKNRRYSKFNEVSVPEFIKLTFAHTERVTLPINNEEKPADKEAAKSNTLFSFYISILKLLAFDGTLIGSTKNF